MEHEWELMTGSDVLKGVDDFPRPEQRAQARQLTLSLPHTDTRFVVSVPAGGRLIFFRRTQIDVDVSSGDEVRRSHAYALGFRAASGPKAVRFLLRRPPNAKLGLVAALRAGWVAYSEARRGAKVLYDDVLLDDDGRGDLDEPKPKRKLVRVGTCLQCGACCEGCDHFEPPSTCKTYASRADGCKHWPPHPYEAEFPQCGYHFFDAETGEEVPRGNDPKLLEMYDSVEPKEVP